MYTQGASYDVCVGRWGDDWLRHMDYWGCLWASWGDLQARYLQWVMVGLPGGICEVISRLHIHLMPSKSPGNILPAPADPLVIRHSSVFWMGWEGSGTLWQHPAQLEKLGTHPHTLTSPPWKKSGAENVSLGTELWCPGGGVMQVNETFPLTLLSAFICSQILLLQWCADTSLLDSWMCTKSLLSVDDCQYQCSLDRK